jgi:hypothetical protein
MNSRPLPSCMSVSVEMSVHRHGTESSHRTLWALFCSHFDDQGVPSRAFPSNSADAHGRAVAANPDESGRVRSH